MSVPRPFASLLVMIPVLVTFAFAGPIGITSYSGQKFPYSASLHSSTGVFNDGSPLDRLGYWLSHTNSRSSTHFLGDAQSTEGAYHQVISASDPTVVYFDDFSGIAVIRFDGEQWQRLFKIPFRRPISSTFLNSFATVLTDRNGSDIVYFRPASDSMAVALDSDGDHIADKILDRNGDTFDDEYKFGDFGIATVAPNGMAYAFTYEERPFPSPPVSIALTFLDTDGDLIPDTPAWPADPRGRLEIPLGISNQAALDSGTDRLVAGHGFPSKILELDGDGFPIPASCRASGSVSGDWSDYPNQGGTTSDAQVLLHDGTMAAYWAFYDSSANPDDTNHGIYILEDVDFDGAVTIKPPSQNSELFPALTEKMFDPKERSGRPAVPELTELRSFSGGNKSVTFADFGIWPDGRAFSFKQASVERTLVTVSLNGLLSFVGPVSASPSLATLDATLGLVAPAWSDQWDTSEVRVFAGCAPTQRRFADGSGAAALSFVIEWRGLISPNGKRTSLRCLLLEDGSFRVDYGAMEIGSMPLVVGYSTDGAGAIISDDLSDNSWGGQPAGTLEEAKLGEEFGAAKPFDLAHKWIRFSGYGDVRGPRPEIVSAVLKKGNKIQMRAPGSNIQPGASLVVDSVETFELTKSATGSKWVVSKKAASTPGTRSVASIWADGQPHSIVVVNPDGTRSDALAL